MAKYFFAIVCSQVIITFCIYVYTAFPSISGGDSGELASIACTGGIAHPPGYPLWLILARSTLWITEILAPHLDVAYRLNIMSAALSAVAAGVLMSTVKALSLSLFGSNEQTNVATVNMAILCGSIFSGALYSFSGGIWEFSTQVTSLILFANTLYLFKMFKQCGH